MQVKKCLVLISGGLDSMLAAKLLIEQGIHVEGINFFTGFSGENPNLIENQAAVKLHSARWVAEQLAIKLHLIDVVNDFKCVLFNPRFGYGANLNPCLDCKIFMVKKAFAYLQQNGFDFLVTGEVLGQRPMSQRKDTLPIVAKDTEDLLLRPLSAKLLAPTLPEREGWVDRKLLCDFNGRTRKPQIALAKKFGFQGFPQPAGGCELTDPVFARRLKDLWQHRPSKEYSLDDIALLKTARHLRPRDNFKLIIGRDESDNIKLQKYQAQHISLLCVSYPGPIVLIDGTVSDDDINLAARLTAYFGKGRHDNAVLIKIKKPDAEEYNLTVKPISEQELLKNWYI